MNLLPENLVTTLTILFIIISLLFKFISEKIELFFKGNIKYRIINSLAPYIYYGPNVGVETVLKLDSPTNDVFQRRLKGQKYLASKLDNKNSVKKYKGKQLSASLVDCRFSLAKVCMPLLRELEFDNIGRNYIVDVKHVSNSSANNQDDGAAGMLNVQTETDTRLYVGNDAVHTFGVKAFYEPIQEEIARRMSQNMLRFCPTAMNGELEKNVELVKRLTGMDQVSFANKCQVEICSIMLFKDLSVHHIICRRSDILSVGPKQSMQPSKIFAPPHQNNSSFASFPPTMVTLLALTSLIVTTTFSYLNAPRLLSTSLRSIIIALLP